MRKVIPEDRIARTRAERIAKTGPNAERRSAFEGWSHRVWLFFAFVLPSLGVVVKYGHGRGLILYLLISALCTCLLLPWAVRQTANWPMAEKTAPRLAVIVFFLFAALFLVVYPLSHSGRLGKGTDRADALNISIPRLLQGKNPYTVRTFLGNPVTPLPGALVLGAPFRVVLRDAAYQNLLWIFVLFFLLCAVAATRAEAFLLWVSLIVFSPALLQDMMTGSDFVANTIYCAVTTYLLLQRLAQPDEVRDRWHLPLLAALWGVCLCSRPTYLFVVPFVFTYATQRRNWVTAFGLTAIALGVYAALVLPIYLPAPQDFSPLHLGSKLTGNRQITSATIGEAAAVMAGVFFTAWAGRRLGVWFVFAASAAFLALPVPFVLLTTLRQNGHADLADLLYAESPSIFLVVALLAANGKKLTQVISYPE